VDPLKIPTAEQGAPGSWAEYMAMRQQKEGGQAKDVSNRRPRRVLGGQIKAVEVGGQVWAASSN